MVTVNKFLESLTKEQVDHISERYLRGWVKLQRDYHIQLRGLNKKRRFYGLPEISRDDVFSYRDQYVKSHYSLDDRIKVIKQYVSTYRMDRQRFKDIEIFDCCFGGKYYAKAFRSLIGTDCFNKISEEQRVFKMMSTQINKYGGVGLASESSLQHAKQTNLKRYGVGNPMQDDVIRDRLFSTMLKRLGQSMELYRQNHDINVLKSSSFNGSDAELFILDQLSKKFGYDDVYYQYGFMPYDNRYPFSCDFYIKSLDLFIELNYYFVHGYHWFDAKNASDVRRCKKLLASGSDLSANAVRVWTEIDLKKRSIAKKNGLNYLVFWNYPLGNHDHPFNLDDFADFKNWFVRFNGDFESFVKVHPENTY